MKTEVDHDVDLIADKTGMKGWQVLSIFIIVVLAVVGLVGWCVWRFFRKKRKGKDGKGKDVPADTADDKDDLQALVGNEEEDNADANKPGRVEKNGRSFKYVIINLMSIRKDIAMNILLLAATILQKLNTWGKSSTN